VRRWLAECRPRGPGVDVIADGNLREAQFEADFCEFSAYSESVALMGALVERRVAQPLLF
jgi:hypothetical protein